MGGTDDPANLIELTIEEHAEAHRLLWETHGRWQDEVAWKALSGQIDASEINYILSVERNLGKNNPMYGKPGPMRGKKHTEESKNKIKKARASQKITHSDETKRRIGEAHKDKIISEEHKKIVIESNKRRAGEKRNTYKNKGIEQYKLTCPHCGIVGGYGALKRWHFDNCKLKVIT